MAKWWNMLKVVTVFVVGITLLFSYIQLKSYQSSGIKYKNFPLPSTQEPPASVTDDSAVTADSVTVEPISVQSKPVRPKPVQPKPVQPKPVQPSPVQPSPVQPKPVQPKPVQPKPVTCHCETNQVTILNMSELIEQFGQLPENMTSYFATDYITDKYTILVPTFRRTVGLFEFLDHYCNAPDVHKILFIWQNVGVPIPENVTNYANCTVPFKFFKSEHNVLSNRFKLLPDIETEAVFSLDDDFIIPYHGIEVGFGTWKVYKHLMVGYMETTHKVQSNGYYKYVQNTHQKMCYSSVLTGLTFLHRKYLDMFFADSLKNVRKLADDLVNGEDLMMNAVVSNYTSQFKFSLPCHALVVDVQRTEIAKDDPMYNDGISRHDDFYYDRENVMNLVAKVYGGAMPNTCCRYWLTGR